MKDRAHALPGLPSDDAGDSALQSRAEAGVRFPLIKRLVAPQGLNVLRSLDCVLCDMYSTERSGTDSI